MQDSELTYSVIQFALVKSSPRLKQLDTRNGMLTIAQKALRVNSEESIDVYVSGEAIAAYKVSYLDWITLSRICDITERFDKDAICEGVKFTFETVETLINIELPDASCASGEWEYSANNTVNGNCFNSDSDTWGTQCGVKAGSLYLFWITDIGRYGLVHESYWSL